MILTRARLNGRRRGCQKLLGSPQAMHAAVESGFAPGVDSGRTLWRLDGAGSPSPTLYLVSKSAPDLTHLVEQAGWPTQPCVDQANYQPFLDKLADGQQWRFRLRANPTHRASDDPAKRIMAHVTAQQQLEWLTKRASASGFSIGSPTDPTATVVEREVLRFYRDKNRVTLGVATFEGLLTVTSADEIRRVLTEGIGRAKGYGCGLMTLARP